MKTWSFAILAVLCNCLSAASTVSPITLTFSGSVSSVDRPGSGYAENERVSFSFTLCDFSSTPPAQYTNNANMMYWQEEGTGDPALWNSVSGTGLGGSWIRPTNGTWSPMNFVMHFSDDNILKVSAATSYPESDSIGLYLAGTPELKVTELYFRISSSDLPGSSAWTDDPNTYLTGFTGTHSVDGIGRVSIGSGTQYEYVRVANFTIDSVTVSSIPEPAQVAALLGAAGLLGAFVLRRRCA